MKEFWDARYKEEGFAYGDEPNNFIRDSISQLDLMGNGLFPAEGEGRNAVFAAEHNWNAYAYDISESGKAKAEELALKHNTKIDYRLGGFLNIDYPENFFDALFFSYVHMPTSMKLNVFERHFKWMKADSFIVFEGFSINNLPYREKNPGVGGPDQEDMLYSVEELRSLLDFFKNLRVWEEEVILTEGKYHVGTAMVIRARNF